MAASGPGAQWSISPAACVGVGFTPVESARGWCPNFSLRNKSFIVRVNGSNETKSRAVSLSIKVPVMVRPGTFRRSLCDRFAIFEHATGRPARRQLHTPEHAGRTLFHRSWRATSSHVSPHPSRTYGVYGNPAWPQFLCKQARHRGERGLARAVTVGGFFGQALNLSE